MSEQNVRGTGTLVMDGSGGGMIVGGFDGVRRDVPLAPPPTWMDTSMDAMRTGAVAWLRRRLALGRGAVWLEGGRPLRQYLTSTRTA